MESSALLLSFFYIPLVWMLKVVNENQNIVPEMKEVMVSLVLVSRV